MEVLKMKDVAFCPSHRFLRTPGKETNTNFGDFVMFCKMLKYFKMGCQLGGIHSFTKYILKYLITNTGVEL